MSPLLSLILDLVIVGLLAATIAYAIILNKQIVKLRESRGEMVELIQGLNEAMAKADTGVRGLKKAAADTGEDLQRTVAKAQTLRDELEFMIEAADALANRLGSVSEREGVRGPVRGDSMRGDSLRNDGLRPSPARAPVRPALAPRPLARPMPIDQHDEHDAPPPVRLDMAPRRVAPPPPEAREPQTRELARGPLTRDGESLSRAERELLQAIENAGRGIG